MDALSKPDLSIAKGTCYLLFAYDVARAIDLDQAERQVVAMKQREVLKHGRRAPKYFAYQPPPLRITQDVAPMAIGDYRSGASVDLVLYDFGAVSVVYTIPLSGPWSGLLTLSNDLYEATSLLADSRKHVEQLLAVIGSAVSKPNIANFVEDYVIYHIEAFAVRHDIDDLCTRYAQDIAQILRAETQPLSQQEVMDALAYRALIRGRRRDDCRLECRDSWWTAKVTTCAPCWSSPMSSYWNYAIWIVASMMPLIDRTRL